ncbi:MAG: 50S ribosomal protein L3 [Thermoplasmata archaeon]|nr:50S ribosomal protein L3 [Thermoplasmata archaeon]
MGDRHRPKRGSMAFSPRKRARRQTGRVKSWPSSSNGEVKVQGFAGYKAGMSHVLIRDENPGSPSAGQEIRKAVTIVETPPMHVLGIRCYRLTPYGKQTAGEAWASCESITEGQPNLSRRVPERKEHNTDEHLGNLKAMAENGEIVEVRLIVSTQPENIKSIPTKTPNIMELGLSGGGISDRIAWAEEKLGSHIGVGDVFTTGHDIDVVAVTKGKGWQGSIKRWGIKLLSHKNSKRRRQGGNMGDFGTGYVRKTIRQAGQTGYHQRTEYNKKVLRISSPDEDEVTPDGGFLKYGEVTNQYMIVQGSLPGPSKRLLRFREATRPRKNQDAVEVTYVSTSSKQGV